MGNQYNRYMKLLENIGLSMDEYDKRKNRQMHVSYMLNRTLSMFGYDGLPETIPQRNLELYFQCGGHADFYAHKDDLYVFLSGLGGPLNPYYLPTIATIANPALNLTVNAKISYPYDQEEKNCIVVPNDSNYIGLLPMFNRYADMLTEAELSLNVAQINSRIIALISAPDDRTRESAEIYLQNIIEGKPGIVAEQAFLDGIRVQPYGTSGANANIKNIIESIQYIKASWLNDLGINANYNMKREALNSAESALNEQALLPLVDDMLRCRQEGLEQVNKKFGTNISVYLNSAWAINHEAVENSIENVDNSEFEGQEVKNDVDKEKPSENNQ